MINVQDLTHEAYVSYMRQLAEEHYLIQHTDENRRFFRINIEEFLDDQVNWEGDGPVMLLGSPTTAVAGVQDNYVDALRCAFMILKKVKPGDYDAENAAISDCKKIGWDIISRILKDATDDSVDDRLIKTFHPREVQAEKVGMALDSEYGYRFTFTLYDPLDLSYDEEKWIANES